MVAFDVKTTEPPEQNDIGPLAVITGAGGGVDAVTVTGLLVAVHPFAVAFVPVTIDDDETDMVEVVAPVDQVILLGIVEVKFTDPPTQKEVGPDAVITGVVAFGYCDTVIEFELDEIHPFASV